MDTMNFISKAVEQKKAVVKALEASGEYNFPQDFKHREYQTVGFHLGRGMHKSAFIIEWCRKHTDTIVIARDHDTCAFYEKYIPDNVNPALLTKGPRPVTTVEMEYPRDKKYLIVEDADEAFTYGNLRKKAFYKWVATYLAWDLTTILVS